LTVRLAVSAPGKLVLLGEYAVLFGAPAAVAAVNRRARVELTEPSDRRWSVAAPGLLPRPAGFELAADGGVRWGDSGNRLPLVEVLLGAMAAEGLLDCRGLRPAAMTLDTQAFFAAGPIERVKLGLGSSAALTVALASGLAQWNGRDDLVADRPRWLQSLVRLHRGLHGGRGSGLDLAAGLMGGCVEYRLDGDGSVAKAETLPLPPDLHLVFIWTGRPADTSSFLRQLDERLAVDNGSIARALERLAAAARVGVAALRDGGAGDAMDAVDVFSGALEALGREAGLAIVSAEHRELGRLVRRHGARYKPSGAGGGDVGIAFAPDPGAAAAASGAATVAGFRVLDLAIDPQGLLSTVVF
jgi:phosphomevalonate kinase